MNWGGFFAGFALPVRQLRIFFLRKAQIGANAKFRFFRKNPAYLFVY